MSEGYRQYSYQAPSGATEILLVRHGESRSASADNPFPLVDGHGDPELHANGAAQALLVRDRLQHENIAAIYVTSLQRTQQTAAPLAAQLGLEVAIEADLREVLLGEWEGGVLRIKAAAGDPIYQQMQAEERWDAIPGAESWTALNQRIMAALGRIHGRHPDEPEGVPHDLGAEARAEELPQELAHVQVRSRHDLGQLLPGSLGVPRGGLKGAGPERRKTMNGQALRPPPPSCQMKRR